MVGVGTLSFLWCFDTVGWLKEGHLVLEVCAADSYCSLAEQSEEENRAENGKFSFISSGVLVGNEMLIITLISV